MALQDSSVPLEQQAQPGVWRFGKAALDEQVAALRVAGMPVELDRSAYDVLLALLRHAGEIVTKDELLEAGWPGRVVSENSLAKAISRLRQALGEDGETLRVVHGYGYRLATAVSFQAVPAENVTVHPHAAERLHEGDRLPHRPGWRLGRRLGEGSAGVIFLAQSDSGETRAVKLATSEAGLRSLKREIALARYIRSVKPDLPSVAPVIDWNLSQPPFFLELPFFAEGHLADWAAAAGGLPVLDLATRLSLCVRLCEAVAALHEIGIIHKDLKPENVYPLADDHGDWHVVLSDLGAGEAAQSPRWAELGITMSIAAATDLSSARAGSLLYMAPEVIAGELPTQRSDVFALGMLVYQLVVGDLRRSIAPGWEADVGDDLLCQDIALAAAANPERRSIDARALAERLRSLEVRRETLAAERQRTIEITHQAEQLTLMSRRRRQLIAGSAVLSVVLAMSVWQQHRTGQAREEAERFAAHAAAEAGKTRQVVSFLTDDVLKQADPYSSNQNTLTLREAIDNAARDVDTRFRAAPDVAAAIHGTLGAAYEGMNDYDKATQHYRKQLAGLRATVPVDKTLVAQTHAVLCTASLWQGDLKRAIPDCERARADFIAAGLEPDRPEVFLALADTRQGRFSAALGRLGPRMERIRRSGDDDLYAYAQGFAAIAHSRMGAFAKVEHAYAEALDARRRQSDGDSMQLGWALADHGKALLLLGRDAEGRARLAAAARMFEKIGGAGHPQTFVPRVHLAAHELNLGQWEAARALARPTYEALYKATGWQHWTIYAALSTMTAEAELGNEAGARRLLAELDQMATEGGMEQNFPYLREPHWTAFAATHLALGDIGRAEHYRDKLLGLLREPDPSPLLRARIDCFDAGILQARGDFAAAGARAQSCRARMLSAATARSPLLKLPERLLAGMPVAAALSP